MTTGTGHPATDGAEATGPRPVLAPGLLRALAGVRISPDGRTVWIADGATGDEDEVVSESPSATRYALARVLYEVLHTGRGTRDAPVPRTLRAPEYEARLARATPHRETRVPAVLLPGRAPDGTRVVELDGLRVAVPPSVPTRGPHEAGDGPQVVTLRLPAARPLVSPGFFLVDGGTGRPDPGELLRIYLRVTDPDRAPRLWHTVLSALEERRVAYRAKIISNPESLPRNDGMVVYLGPGAWHAAPAITEAAHGAEVPDGRDGAFAHPLAPGVTAAWEPRDDRTGMRSLSFGEHRAHVVARAYVQAAADGLERPTAGGLADACVAGNVDPGDPARNLDSAAWPWRPTPG
ncbi:T3SS effector HopA1 family protein [Streptomyces sp. JNUCC 64]